VTRANRVTVEGTAPPEAMVGLYVNEEKVAVQLAIDGRWKFEEVPLTSAINTIQARYFDSEGNSSFSKATALKLDATPAHPTPPIAPHEGVILAGMNLIRAPRGRKEVLLTFDGGSNANATGQILQGLKRHGVKATVFLTGEYIQKYPDFVREMVQDGHVIGNHTFSHPHLTTYSFNGRNATLPGVTTGFLKDQLSRAAEVFRSVAGKEMDPYWRAPFGEANQTLVAWAQETGYRHVAWTPQMDTLDWVADRANPLYKGPEQILKGLLRQADSAQAGGVDGGIILMHLGTEREGEQGAQQILEPLITELQSRGYSFVNVAAVWPWDGKALK
jgi:peptidoglycan/xylan/chitin deacetylase (PgdA/CDA1 family)